jgi:YD repeat-containing protein
LASFTGSTPVWKQTSSTTYDTQGRVTAVFDALNRQTQTSYTPASGGPVTQIQTTNPLGHVSTTTMDPAWGSPTLVVDPQQPLHHSALRRIGAADSGVVAWP